MRRRTIRRRGLVVLTAYTMYGDGKVNATRKVRDRALDRPFDESRMSMPTEGIIDTTTP